MGWLDDRLRELADHFDVKANIAYISLAEKCHPVAYRKERELLPSAYFRSIGVCKDTHSRIVGGLELDQAIVEAASHLKENSYLVIMIPTIDGLHPGSINGLYIMSQILKKLKLRLVVINFDQHDFFMNTIQLNYSDLILLGNQLKREQYTQDRFVELIDQQRPKVARQIREQLLPAANFTLSIAEINRNLGHNVAIDSATPKPVLFSRKQIDQYVPFVDLCAVGIILYKLIQSCRHTKTNKRKLRI